ncbi:hypothetical protein Q3G72_013430 [Acer saccharum]|nr:hypothetical protein Q3G72_013430 [Acer saccharum]
MMFEDDGFNLGLGDGVGGDGAGFDGGRGWCRQRGCNLRSTCPKAENGYPGGPGCSGAPNADDSPKFAKSSLGAKGLDKATSHALKPRSGPLGKLNDEVLDDTPKAGVLVAPKEEVIVVLNVDGLDRPKEVGVGVKRLDRAVAHALKIAPSD